MTDDGWICKSSWICQNGESPTVYLSTFPFWKSFMKCYRHASFLLCMCKLNKHHKWVNSPIHFISQKLSNIDTHIIHAVNLVCYPISVPIHLMHPLLTLIAVVNPLLTVSSFVSSLSYHRIKTCAYLCHTICGVREHDAPRTRMQPHLRGLRTRHTIHLTISPFW